MNDAQTASQVAQNMAQKLMRELAERGLLPTFHQLTNLVEHHLRKNDPLFLSRWTLTFHRRDEDGWISCEVVPVDAVQQLAEIKT